MWAEPAPVLTPVLSPTAAPKLSPKSPSFIPYVTSTHHGKWAAPASLTPQSITPFKPTQQIHNTPIKYTQIPHTPTKCTQTPLTPPIIHGHYHPIHTNPYAYQNPLTFNNTLSPISIPSPINMSLHIMNDTIITLNTQNT
jgi:hypothetical protein